MLRWMDGFEHYGLTETHMTEGVGGAAAWSEVDSGWTLQSANPATGTYHLRLRSAIASALPTFPRRRQVIRPLRR
jgi:hypothetical protein